MEDEFGIFHQLIIDNYQSEIQDKSEVATKILKYQSHVSYLDFLQQFLERCMNSDLHIIITINFMKEIVKLRGCLMSQEDLISHFMFLKQFVVENNQKILSNDNIIQSISQDFGFTIRVTIESDFDEGNKLINDIKELFDDEDMNLRAIALKLMATLVDCFRDPLRYNSYDENVKIKKNFEETYLPKFICEIHPIILEGSELILYSSLELLLHCFCFCDNQNRSTVYNIPYPKDFSPYFESPETLERIVGLCLDQDESISNLAYVILYYMSAASNVWNLSSHKKDFYIFLSQYLMDIIKAQDENSIHKAQVCKILKLLGYNIDFEKFLENQFAQQFLEFTLQFSSLIFETGDPVSTKDLFLFWSHVAGDITDNLLQLIGDFIEITLNSIAQNGEYWLENISEYDSTVFEPIWQIVHSCYEPIYDLIIDKIEKMGEYQSNLLQLTFLILLVNSRFTNNRDSEAEEKAFRMYDTAFKLIEATSIVEDAASPAFENSIIIFIDNYQRTHFSGTSVKYKSEEEIKYKQGVINICIARILSDFELFAYLSSYPNLSDRLFALVNNLVKRKECLELLSNTPILESLFNQSLSIQFDGLDPEDAKKPRINLYSLYTSLIGSIKDLQIFLNKFDSRFEELKSTNYSNEEEIFALFCDLRGIFKYLLTNVTQSKLDDIPKKFIRVCNWFSDEHVQDSVDIIANNAKNHDIVNIVCSVWISLFPDRFETRKTKEKNQPSSFAINDHFDGFGIILFKTSLLIVEAVFQSCSDDFSNFDILFKLIRYCMTTKYTNFGVMSYYNDNSFDRMSAHFFDMLKAIGFDDLIGHEKVLNNILLTMGSITNSEKCLDELLVSEDNSNLAVILEFTAKCMYLDSHNRDIENDKVLNKRDFYDKDFAPKNKVSNRTLWENVWNVLQPLLEKVSDVPDIIQLFKQHTIILLNNVLMKNDKKQIALGPILLASFIYDQPFVTWLVGIIIETFDEQFQPYVKEQFDILFEDIESVTWGDFNRRLEDLSLGFKRYQTDFIDLPEINRYFVDLPEATDAL